DDEEHRRHGGRCDTFPRLLARVRRCLAPASRKGTGRQWASARRPSGGPRTAPAPFFCLNRPRRTLNGEKQQRRGAVCSVCLLEEIMAWKRCLLVAVACLLACGIVQLTADDRVAPDLEGEYQYQSWNAAENKNYKGPVTVTRMGDY